MITTLLMSCVVTITTPTESETFRFPTYTKAKAFVMELDYGFPDLGEHTARIECDPVNEKKYQQTKKEKRQ